MMCRQGRPEMSLAVPTQHIHRYVLGGHCGHVEPWFRSSSARPLSGPKQAEGRQEPVG